MEGNMPGNLAGGVRRTERHSSLASSTIRPSECPECLQGHGEAESSAPPCADPTDEETKAPEEDLDRTPDIQDCAERLGLSEATMGTERQDLGRGEEDSSANTSQSRPARTDSWRSILLYLPSGWQVDSLFAFFTKTWLGNVITMMSLAVGLVPLAYGLHLQMKSWKLQSWTARKDAKESCMNDQNLGIPLSEYCRYVLHQQTKAPPLLRRRSLNPFKTKDYSHYTFKPFFQPDGFSPHENDQVYSPISYAAFSRTAGIRTNEDVLRFTAVVVLTIIIGIATTMHFCNKREPFRPVVSPVRSGGIWINSLVPTTLVSFVKTKKRRIFGASQTDEYDPEDEKLLLAPEEVGDSDSDTWTILEDEKRVQYLLDKLEESDLQEDVSKEDTENMSRILDLKNALQLSGKPQCVVFFRYMTFQQFERRFRCHLNRAQKRPHPFPSYCLYEFTPLGWRGLKDFYKHRKQGHFPKLENQLLDLRAQFPLPNEYETTIDPEERSIYVPYSKTTDEYSDYLNRRPDTPGKAVQFEDAVHHFSQTFDNTEDPIYLFQFDLGMFALLKPNSEDDQHVVNGNGGSRPSKLEDQSLWHAVTLALEADVAQYEGALTFLNSYFKKHELQLGLSISGEYEEEPAQDESIHKQRSSSELREKSFSNDFQKQSLLSRRGTLRNRLKGFRDATFRKSKKPPKEPAEKPSKGDEPEKQPMEKPGK